MYVCVCNAVSDRDIYAAVERGACHLRDLTRDLKLGTCCGRCVDCAKRCLDEALTACNNRDVAA